MEYAGRNAAKWAGKQVPLRKWIALRNSWLNSLFRSRICYCNNFLRPRRHLFVALDTARQNLILRSELGYQQAQSLQLFCSCLYPVVLVSLLLPLG